MELYELELEAREICRFWVKNFGIGFHLDTRPSEYSPSLSKNIQKELHIDLRRLHTISDLTGLDMYAIVLDAMKDFHLIEDAA
jgi:hypothetical protein